MKNIEQELKLLLDEREYNIIYATADVTPKLQTNYYFGYADMAQDVMVRLRHKEDSFTLCYKRRMSQIDGVMVCDEREREITHDVALRMLKYGITATELYQIFGVELENMRCLGSLETYRAKFKLDEWTLELDKNVYFGKVDHELECEDNDVVSLNKLKNYLYYKFGVVIKPAKPKVERFFEMRLG